jgi:hypothetical protein
MTYSHGFAARRTLPPPYDDTSVLSQTHDSMHYSPDVLEVGHALQRHHDALQAVRDLHSRRVQRAAARL